MVHKKHANYRDWAFNSGSEYKNGWTGLMQKSLIASIFWPNFNNKTKLKAARFSATSTKTTEKLQFLQSPGLYHSSVAKSQPSMVDWLRGIKKNLTKIFFIHWSNHFCQRSRLILADLSGTICSCFSCCSNVQFEMNTVVRKSSLSHVLIYCQLWVPSSLCLALWHITDSQVQNITRQSLPYPPHQRRHTKKQFCSWMWIDDN